MDDTFTKILKKSKKSNNKIVTQNNILDIVDDNKLILVEGKKEEQTKATVIEWNDIKDKRHGFEQPIELWSKNKLFSYFRYRCKKKNSHYADVIDSAIALTRRGNFMRELFIVAENEMRQKIDNKLIQTYIDFYTQHLLEQSVVRKQKFDAYDIVRKSTFRAFAKSTNIKQTQDYDIEEIIGNSIDDVYETGGINFILKYGIVVINAYLRIKKNLTEEQSYKASKKFLQDAFKENVQNREQIVKITESQSPYCEKYKTSSLESLLHEFNVVRVIYAVDGKKFF